VGSRAAANKAGKRVDLAQLPFLFSSLLVVTTTVTCNNRKRTTQSILIFVFVLQICFSGSVFFCSSVFSFRFPFFSVFRRGLSAVVLLLSLAGCGR